MSKTLSTVVNAFTVDVEDYFQVSAFDRTVRRDDWGEFESRVEGNTHRLLELLAQYKVSGTFFVLGWIAERHSHLVTTIARAGHEIGAHGYWHRLIYEQSPAEFREDVRRAKGVLESIIGQPVLGYRAPSYSVKLKCSWALRILAEEGFAYDASIFPIHHDRYGIASAPRHPHVVDGQYGLFSHGTSLPLMEVPASTVRVGGVNLPIAGGGYFRLLPYAWTSWGIARVNKSEGRPVVFYVHPWEVDPNQPRISASMMSRVRHYRHLTKTEERLRRLLSDFAFAPIVGAILAADGAVAPRFRQGSVL